MTTIKAIRLASLVTAINPLRRSSIRNTWSLPLCYAPNTFLIFLIAIFHALCWSTAPPRIFALPAFIERIVAIVEIR
jgi:hypothetical protein